jgi:riboflavin biosynthesis pyrimidine reductase
MEIIWFTGMSMDAKLATAEQGLEFLDAIEQDDASLAVFSDFYASVDAIIVGAGTLRWLIAGGHGWPHGEKPTFAVTHDAALVASVGPTSAPLRRFEDVRAMLDELRASGATRVWLSGGGVLAGQLLALDAIDVVDMTIAPLALGSGPSLFGTLALPPRAFELERCERSGRNAVRVVWRRRRE